MNAQQFLTWMRNPGQTSREESAQLDALLDAFPYFQSGHLLYIKNLHNQGSFLYNNQLKTAAAYAVNRKVLYQLITLKQSAVNQSAVNQSAVNQSGSLQSSAFDSAQSDNVSTTTSVVPKQEEQVSIPPKFPPKKFTSNPDEWEAGMLRQLQLLHHWRGQEKTGVQPTVEQSSVEQSSVEQSAVEQSAVNQSAVEQSAVEQSAVEQSISQKSKVEEPVAEQEIPAAKEEINTLLYVLVEPGQPEDLSQETAEENQSEEITDESEVTQWEITPATEPVAEVNVAPTDPVQQEILVEAISSTFELEVDDTIPTVEELKPFRIEPITEAPEEKVADKVEAVAETVVEGFEKMSFGEWLKEVNKKVPSELPKTALSGDTLIEQFIKDEPRIKVKKAGFFNPVNMAKKSVQESDEFITETLARIYAKQGNYHKAIRAYQKLSLKFPEKTTYFAALIEELKRTPNK